MKYYRFVVAYLLEADNESTAQWKAVINKANLTTVVSTDDVTARVEPLTHKAHTRSPTKAYGSVTTRSSRGLTTRGVVDIRVGSHN